MQHRRGNGAAKCIADMAHICHSGNPLPDEAFCVLLQTCLAKKDLALGRQVQRLIISCGSYSKSLLRNSIIRMFAACGSLRDARQVFLTTTNPDVYAWEAIISAHLTCGQHEQAINIYHGLRSSNVSPNNHVFVASLKACAATAMLAHGRTIHHHILHTGTDTTLHIGSILLDMYAKCGCVTEACNLFNRMPVKDLVLWNAMITGHAQQGSDKSALLLFEEMLGKGISPDERTFASLFRVCGCADSVEDGRSIHSLMSKIGCKMNLIVGNSLIDMYGKCSILCEAEKVFDDLLERDAISWTAIMNAYGSVNDWKMAIECFEKMQKDNVKPDEATFKCLLSACGHAGLYNEGEHYFQLMKQRYGLIPTEDHIVCMADLHARSGNLYKAKQLLLSTPLLTDVGWTALLSACKKHGNVELGRRCFDHAVDIDPTYGSNYAVMSSIYADAGMWGHVHEIEDLRKHACLRHRRLLPYTIPGQNVND